MRRMIDFDTTISNTITNESFKIDFNTVDYKVSYEELLVAHHDLNYTIDREISRVNTLVVSTQNQIAQESMIGDTFNKVKEIFLTFIEKLKNIWNKIVEKVKNFFNKLFGFFKTDKDINIIAKLVMGKKGQELSKEDDASRVILLWNEELVKSKIKHFPNLLVIDKDMIKALNDLCYSFPYHYENKFPGILTDHYTVLREMFRIKKAKDFFELKITNRRDIEQFDKALNKIRISDRNNNPTLIVKNGETYNLVIDTSDEEDESNWFKAELIKNDTTPSKDDFTGYDLTSQLLTGLIMVIKDRRKSVRLSSGLEMLHSRLEQELNSITNKFTSEDIELTQSQANSMLSYLTTIMSKLPIGLNTTVMDSTMEAIKLLKLLRKTTPLLITDIITPEIVFGVGRKPLSGEIYQAFTAPIPTNINKEFIDKLNNFTFDDLIQNQLFISEDELTSYTKDKFSISNGEIIIHYVGHTGNPVIDGNCYALPGNVIISLVLVDKIYNSSANKKYKFSKEYIRKALVCHEVGHVIHYRKLGATKASDATLHGMLLEMFVWGKTDSAGAYASKVSDTIAPHEAFADAYMIKRMGMDKETYINFNNVMSTLINTDESMGIVDDNLVSNDNGEHEFTSNNEGKVRYNLRVDNVFDLVSKI